MYSCSVCGKPGTRKGHAPPCDPNMKEKWEGQVDADVGEEEEGGEEEEEEEAVTLRVNLMSVPTDHGEGVDEC